MKYDVSNVDLAVDGNYIEASLRCATIPRNITNLLLLEFAFLSTLREDGKQRCLSELRVHCEGTTDHIKTISRFHEYPRDNTGLYEI